MDTEAQDNAVVLILDLELVIEVVELRQLELEAGQELVDHDLDEAGHLLDARLDFGFFRLYTVALIVDDVVLRQVEAIDVELYQLSRLVDVERHADFVLGVRGESQLLVPSLDL